MTVWILQCIAESCGDSQFEDKHNICPVLVNIVERYNVGMLELLQDVHFPRNLLSFHTPSAGPAQALLDELGRVLIACALLYASLDNRKLPTADKREAITTKSAKRAYKAREKQ